MADRGAMTHSAANVVCGLDTSDRAPAVLRCAAALARRLGVPLQAVHCSSGDADADTAMAQLAALQQVDELTIERGSPAEVLRSAMDGALLGVVGSRGRGPLRAALLGSVSSELAEEAPCPLVVIPPDVEPRELAEEPAIVCRVDGSVDDRPALQAAAWIAAALGGTFDAVNVRGRMAVDTGADVMALDRVLEELGVRPAVRVEAGSPADQIGQVAERHRAALIVVRWDGDVLVPGAVAGRLAARARVPVMIVPPRVSMGAPAARAA
jgi:nucleotide-binding universal stress UspA family protein